MIFNTHENTGLVASSGMGSTSVARIATTSHMFSILSSRLYSDKVAAVLREIGCNALDAHTEAGTPNLPFEVKLPNSIDPTFHIKDSGPGLDEDGVRNLYMTYGESTKQGSNKFVGAMGLGSKSPFAYAHTFTIVAAKHGIKRFFTAYLNEDRVPVVTKTLECESEPDWPNGLMVTFPVEQSDMAEFHNKARLIYSWFKVAPTILGLPEEEKPVFPSFEMTKPGRYGFKPANQAYSRSPAVVMGNIRYPLEMNKVYERFPEVREVFSTIAVQGVHLFVEIGEVMFTPNREALEYDKGTLETLKNRFIEVIKDIGQTLANALAEREDTTVAQLRKLEALRNEYASTGLLSRTTLPQMLRVCGMSKAAIEALPSMAEAFVIKAPETVGLKWLTEERGDESSHLMVYLIKRETTKSENVRVKTHVVSRGGYLPSRALQAKQSPVAFPASSNVGVFYLEGKKEGKSKLQALIASKELDFALLVVPFGKATEEDAKEYAEFIAGPEGLDGYPVISTKTLDLPKERVRQLLNRRVTRLTEEERLQRIRTLVVTGSHNSSDTNLYDAAHSGTRWYAIVDDMRRHNTSRQLAGDDGISCGLSQDTLRQLIKNGQLKAIFEAVGVAPTGDLEVALITQGSMKRADPKTLGMLNIADLLKGWFKDEDTLKLLSSFVDDQEVLDAAYNEVSNYWAALYRFNGQREADSLFWKAISHRYAGTELMTAMDIYASYEKARDEDDSRNPVLEGLRALKAAGFAQRKIEAMFEGKDSDRAKVLRSVNEKLRVALVPLSWDHLCNNANGGELEVGMAFFDLAMMLAGVMPSRLPRDAGPAV